MPTRILVVDDESTIRVVLRKTLERRGFQVWDAESAVDALEMLNEADPHVALLDIQLPGMNGLDLLREVKQRSPRTEVIMITSHGSVKTAVGAMQDGAYAFLQKPFGDIDEVRLTVERALERRDLESKNRGLVEDHEAKNRELSVALDRLQHAYDSLRETQDLLVLSERQKAITQMASGVAHDFNNALAVILGRSQLGLDKMGRPDVDLASISDDLESIHKVALKAAESVTRIQNYSDTTKPAVEEVIDLNDVVHSAVEMGRPKWLVESESQGIEIDLELDLDEVLPILGNPQEMTQVVSSLLFNAVEAMPAGGRLTITTRSHERRVELQVRDTGIGMSNETKKRLLEPFYTTKESGQGLGLSISYGIISRYAGHIEVESEQGQGSCIVITLPGIELGQEAGDDPSADGRLRSANVMLVEDEDEVRSLYEDLLLSMNHQVTSVCDAMQALALLEVNEYDLIITDFCMPGMTGVELARKVKDVDPDLPIVLVSGWTMETKKTEIQDAGIDYVVHKPCTLEVLQQAIQTALSCSESKSRVGSI